MLCKHVLTLKLASAVKGWGKVTKISQCSAVMLLKIMTWVFNYLAVVEILFIWILLLNFFRF